MRGDDDVQGDHGDNLWDRGVVVVVESRPVEEGCRGVHPEEEDILVRGDGGFTMIVERALRFFYSEQGSGALM
jgi:hypothetical protein